MRIDTVTRAQIEAHPTRSLLPSSYINVPHRDVTIRLSGEVARYVRAVSLNNGVSMRDVVQGIMGDHIMKEVRCDGVE